MNKMITAVGLACAMLFSAGAAHADAKNPKIGFSIDDLRLERWTRDRDYFTQAAAKLGAKEDVQTADASEQRQIAPIENLISRGWPCSWCATKSRPTTPSWRTASSRSIPCCSSLSC